MAYEATSTRGRPMKWYAIAFSVIFFPHAQALAQEAPCVPHQGPPTLRPIMATHTQPPYPTAATNMEEEGKTLMRVSIGPDGIPTSVIVETSSGSVRLDSAAAAHIKANWRWLPPLGPDCAPVKVETGVLVSWALHDAPPPDTIKYTELHMAPSDYPPGAMDRKEQGYTTIVITLPADGSAPTYSVNLPSSFPDLDDRALEIIKTRYRWKAGEMNGKPVVTTLGVVAIWTLPLPSSPKN